MSQRPSHPSGKPIRRDRVVGRPIWRIPDRGSVIPRLQTEPRTEAIGFVTEFGSSNPEPEE